MTVEEVDRLKVDEMEIFTVEVVVMLKVEEMEIDMEI